MQVHYTGLTNTVCMILLNEQTVFSAKLLKLQMVHIVKQLQEHEYLR